MLARFPSCLPHFSSSVDSFSVVCFSIERISELIHALLHFGLVDQSRTLQAEFQAFLSDVDREESTPMPQLENATAEQAAALERYWNWPAMCHPERDAKPKRDHLTMPFLFPAPTSRATDAAASSSSHPAGKASDAVADGRVPGAAQPKSVLEDADDDDNDLLGGFI